LEQARALFALGSLLRRTGRRRQAREILEQAREVFVRCGAAGLAADADAELARIGGRTSGGSSGLTASERQVAECVARGMSNADAAHALHLSVKTVETHLSHAYRKLGVANRVGLAHALGPVTGRPDDAR
jgi:DNA-binding NarL/FixJ family response regulator